MHLITVRFIFRYVTLLEFHRHLRVSCSYNTFVASCCLQSKPRRVAPWSCSQCHKMVTEEREAHDFMHHEYKAFVLDCPQCPHQDIVKDDFVGHLEHAHDVTLGLDDQVEDYVQPASKFRRMPACPHCGIRRTTVQSMADHRANAHGDVTPAHFRPGVAASQPSAPQPPPIRAPSTIASPASTSGRSTPVHGASGQMTYSALRDALGPRYPDIEVPPQEGFTTLRSPVIPTPAAPVMEVFPEHFDEREIAECLEGHDGEQYRFDVNKRGDTLDFRPTQGRTDSMFSYTRCSQRADSAPNPYLSQDAGHMERDYDSDQQAALLRVRWPSVYLLGDLQKNVRAIMHHDRRIYLHTDIAPGNYLLITDGAPPRVIRCIVMIDWHVQNPMRYIRPFYESPSRVSPYVVQLRTTTSRPSQVLYTAYFPFAPDHGWYILKNVETKKEYEMYAQEDFQHCESRIYEPI